MGRTPARTRSITILGFAGLAVLAGGLGVYAVMHHDASLPVYLAIAVAVLVIWWSAMEILFPH